MEEKGKKKDGLVILGLIALIVLMFLGVKLIFGFLDKAIPQTPSDSTQAVSQEADSSRSETFPAPRYCPSCGQALPESFQWGQFCPFCGKKAEP